MVSNIVLDFLDDYNMEVTKTQKRKQTKVTGTSKVKYMKVEENKKKRSVYHKNKKCLKGYISAAKKSKKLIQQTNSVLDDPEPKEKWPMEFCGYSYYSYELASVFGLEMF